MKRKQLMALSFDKPTHPAIEVFFPDEKTSHKLYYALYNKPDGKVYSSGIKLNAANSKTLLNEALIGGTCKQDATQKCKLQSFSLEGKLPVFKINHHDWIIYLRLHEPEKPVDETLFNYKDGYLTSRCKSNEDIYSVWLINQFQAKCINELTDKDWPALYELFSQINQQNACSIFMTDGKIMLAYQGSNFSNSMYYVRSNPPHNGNDTIQAADLQFSLRNQAINHTFVTLSTEPVKHIHSKFFNLHQMMVIEDSVIIWNNDPNALWQKRLIKQPVEHAASNKEYLQQINLLQPGSIQDIQKNSVSLTIPTSSMDNQPSIYSISHNSVYEYDEPVYFSSHLFRLQPVHDLTQFLIDYKLSVKIDGKPIESTPCSFSGAFGNMATFIEIKEPYQRLEIISESQAVVFSPPMQRIDLLHQQRNIPLIWMPWDRIMMQAYLVPPELPESQLRELSEYALSFVSRNNNDVYEVLDDINRTINLDFKYVSGSTALETTPYEVYTRREGVCQDFANLFICLARLLNIPARYRTGYLYTGTEYAHKEQGDATHAWLEVFLPYIGWQGYDPTNYCIAEKNHIRVASGRKYSDAAPTSGTIYHGGGSEKLSINVHVIRMEAGKE